MGTLSWMLMGTLWLETSGQGDYLQKLVFSACGQGVANSLSHTDFKLVISVYGGNISDVSCVSTLLQEMTAQGDFICKNLYVF